jgi:hypothetical protein
MIYIWPLSVREDFIFLLKEMNMAALVLTAYYCAQLCAFRDYWFVGQRAQMLFSEIATALPGQLSTWLDWPKNVIYHDLGM